MTGYSKFKGCDKKQKYINIDEAMIKGKFSISKSGIQLYTYLCRNCNHWHLTKQETKYKII